MPIRVCVTGDAASVCREYRYRCWKNPDMMPPLVLSSIDSAFAGSVAVGGDMTLRSNYEIRLADGTAIHKRQVNSVDYAPVADPLGLLAFDLFALLENPYREAQIESLEVYLEAERGLHYDTLVSLRSQHRQYEAGDRVELWAEMLPWRGRQYERSFEIELPPDLDPGNYVIHLADAQGAHRVLRSHQPSLYAPRDYEDVLEMVRAHSQPRDELWLYLFAPALDLELKGESFRGLPDSVAGVMRATAPPQLQQQAVGDLVWARTFPTETPTFGSSSITIQVVDHFNR
jgi:hypothetical protein